MPHTLLELAHDGVVSLVTSPALLAELTRVLERPKFDEILRKTRTSRDALFAQVRLLSEVIDAPSLTQPVCRDPDDDAVLALARVALVDLIVSGDDDLLSLREFDGVPIVTPAQALERLRV